MATLYDEDLALWAEQQGTLLRESAVLRPNEPIDWEKVAEEVATLGRSQVTEVQSRLRRIVEHFEHLLKLQFAPTAAPRQGWRETVRQQRSDLELVVQSSPSLRPRLAELAEQVAGRATRDAAGSLSDHGEDAAAAAALRHGGAYCLAELLDGWPTTP